MEPSQIIVAGFIFIVGVLNWKAALFLSAITSILILVVGWSTALLLVSGFGLLLLTFNRNSALILGATILTISHFTNVATAVSLLILVVVVVILLLAIILSVGLNSIQGGLMRASTFALALIVGRFSILVKRIELLGAAFPVSKIFSGGFSIYPGSNFVKSFRADFVSRGSHFVREGIAEVDKTPNELAKETRRAYDNSGRLLSEGEATLAFVLLVISILSHLPNGLSPPQWVTPPDWLGTMLSIFLLLAVGLRTAALDEIMYQDVTKENDFSELAAMHAWNLHMSNGTQILKTLLEFKAIATISPKASDFYLDWALGESFEGDGVSTLGLISQTDKLMALAWSDILGESPEESSQRIFGKNVFKGSKYFESENKPGT